MNFEHSLSFLPLIRILPALNNNYFHFYFSEVNSIFARQNRNGGFVAPFKNNY